MMGKDSAYSSSSGSKCKCIVLEAAPIVYKLSMNKSGTAKTSKQWKTEERGLRTPDLPS